MQPNNQKHVFVCTNDRGEMRTCCKNVGGYEVYRDLKNFVMREGLVGRVYVTQTKCLGFCNNNGANIVIYPEKKWFLEANEGNIEEVKQLIKR